MGKVEGVVPIPIIENQTVSVTKKKRKFTWTSARRAAFQKCVAARKNTKRNKQVLESTTPMTPITIPPKKEEQSICSSSDDQDRSSDSLSISSEESIIIEPKHKKRSFKKSNYPNYKKQFTKLSKQIKGIHKKIKHTPQHIKDRAKISEEYLQEQIEPEKIAPRYIQPKYYYL